MFNAGEKINLCLQSIYNQQITPPPQLSRRCSEQSCIDHHSFEVIIVDDGSTDNSVSIVSKWVERFQNIKLLCQANSGVSAARNNGIANARGEYLCFVDADDFIHPQAVEILTKCAAHADADIMSYDIEWVDEKSIPDLSCLPDINNLNSEIITPQNYLIKIKIQSGVWRYLFRKKLIDDNGILFDSQLRYSEDQVFVLESVACADRVRVLNVALYYYVQYQASTIHKAIANKTLELIYSYKVLAMRYSGIGKNPFYAKHEALSIMLADRVKYKTFLFISGLIKSDISVKRLKSEIGKLKESGLYPMASFPHTEGFDCGNGIMVKIVYTICRSQIGVEVLHSLWKVLRRR